nr:MAG TPA: hypothetical protein [Caudoviricetes sp.]
MPPPWLMGESQTNTFLFWTNWRIYPPPTLRR